MKQEKNMAYNQQKNKSNERNDRDEGISRWVSENTCNVYALSAQEYLKNYEYGKGRTRR